VALSRRAADVLTSEISSSLCSRTVSKPLRNPTNRPRWRNKRTQCPRDCRNRPPGPRPSTDLELSPLATHSATTLSHRTQIQRNRVRGTIEGRMQWMFGLDNFAYRSSVRFIHQYSFRRYMRSKTVHWLLSSRPLPIPEHHRSNLYL